MCGAAGARSGDVVYYHYNGIRANGLGYVKQFTGAGVVAVSA